MSNRQHIFITHDPQWRNENDIQELFSQLSNKNIWYRRGRWSGKILQNISTSIGKKMRFLSLDDRSDSSPHDELFKTEGRRMDLIIVFYQPSRTSLSNSRPSWCSSVIKNAIKSGTPLLTRSVLEKGWVFSWGEPSVREEKRFDEIGEFGNFVEKWSDYAPLKNQDWIESMIGLKLTEEDDDDPNIKLIRELTDKEYKEKIDRAKQRMTEAKEKVEASKVSVQFYDPTTRVLKKQAYKKNLQKKIEEQCKKTDTVDVGEDDPTPPEIGKKKGKTRKFGKMKITI